MIYLITTNHWRIMIDITEFIRNVQQIKNAKLFTLAELAKDMGLCLTTTAHLLKGKKPMRFQTLKKVRDYIEKNKEHCGK